VFTHGNILKLLMWSPWKHHKKCLCGHHGNTVKCFCGHHGNTVKLFMWSPWKHRKIVNVVTMETTYM